MFRFHIDFGLILLFICKVNKFFSIIAHDFIPADYWKKNKNAMASIYLPNSETYLAIVEEKIIGFVAMVDNLLAAIFVDNQIQGKGIGKILLIDALNRCFEISKNIGSFAVIVDPIDQSAESFYNKYGFIKLHDSGKMFLAMKTVGQLFE